MSNAVQLPAGTTLGKSFEYGVDVNLGTFADPEWQPVRRLSAYQPAPAPTTQDAQTYDDLGAPNNAVTGWGWGLSFNVQVNRSITTGLYLPEVECILERTRPSSVGELAVLDTRWYHKPAVGVPNPHDAGRGQATVSTSRQNTGPNGEIEVLGVTLAGQGPYEEIANPFTSWGLTAPIIGAVAGQGGAVAGDNDLITITGSGFLGATAVSISGTPVEHLVISGATIVATMPLGNAGDVPIIVTTPGGASAAFTYTRGA